MCVIIAAGRLPGSNFGLAEVVGADRFSPGGTRPEILISQLTPQAINDLTLIGHAGAPLPSKSSDSFRDDLLGSRLPFGSYVYVGVGNFPPGFLNAVFRGLVSRAYSRSQWACLVEKEGRPAEGMFYGGAPETKHHGRSSGFTVSGRFAVSADYIVWGIPDAVHPDFAEYLPGRDR